MLRGRHGANAVDAVGNGAATPLQVAVGYLATAAAPKYFRMVAHACYSLVTGEFGLCVRLSGKDQKAQRSEEENKEIVEAKRVRE